MHELSLCSAIAATVTDHAAGRPVERITLRIGAFRQVVPETLKFCWGTQAVGTPLAESELVVDYVAATVACADCGHTTTLEHPILICEECSGRQVDLVTGEEFLIESIDVAAAAGSGHGERSK